jgi:DNA-binding CsgD family transcriptional regulator
MRIPRSLGPPARAVLAARGKESRLRHVVDQSRVPMVIVNDERRYLAVNWPAQLAFRLTLAEMRKLRIDDLTPPDQLGAMASSWEELIGTGCVAGSYLVATPDGGQFEICYWGTANALPGEHVIAFGLARPFDDGSDGLEDSEAVSPTRLTPRELELLQLAAHGLSGPKIAEELVLSPATVRTHFANIYQKLDVGDRAGAVAEAMRLGLIE